MTVNGSISYLPYLNKLVHQYNNSYHHFSNKKSINTDHSASTENVDSNPKAPKFKGYSENWPREIFIIDSVLKTIPSTYK